MEPKPLSKERRDYLERRPLHHLIIGTDHRFTCLATSFRHAVLAADDAVERMTADA